MKTVIKTLFYFYIVFLLPACTLAQQDGQENMQVQTWQLNNSVQWLHATNDSEDTNLYGLDSLGKIIEIDVRSGTSKVVATAHERSFLTSCQDNLVYVDADSKLSILKLSDYSISTASEVAPFSMPTCLENGSNSGQIVAVDNAGDLILVDIQGEVIKRLVVDALRDAQLRQADVGRDGTNEIIVLTQPTERYGHGVLGDRTEAESIMVVDSESWAVKASFQLAEPFVFEQLRVEVLDTGTQTLILGTRSSRQTGAGVIALELQRDALVQVDEVGVIGLGNRWLNLFDSANGEAYAIKTPHIGGPLQRYSFVDGELELSSQTVEVTNHRIGSRNLDLAVLDSSDELKSNTVSFIAPQYDQKTLEAFSCERSEACESTWTFKMDGFLTSNLVVLQVDAKRFVAAADQGGKVYLIDRSSF